MNLTTIPVLVTEEAGRRVAVLGMQRELDLMLEWTRNNVPNLRGIQVTPGSIRRPLKAHLVVIKDYRSWDEEHPPTDLIDWDWAGWKAETFPPRVCANFIMSSTFQPVPTS